MEKHLVLFLRAPELGRGKTRLARDIGRPAALRFQRFAAARLIRSLAGDPRWRTWLAVTPDKAVLSRAKPWGNISGGTMIAQGGGDLADRMRRFLDGLPGQVVILGSDLPEVTRRDVARAFRALNGADLVLGPADDGGYWLIGTCPRLKAHTLFKAVRWSSATTRCDTLANLPGNRKARLLDLRRDVDQGADLIALRHRTGFNWRYLFC